MTIPDITVGMEDNEVNKIYASEFDQSQHPIRVGHGSLLPGEIFKRAWIAMRRKIQSEEKPIAQRIRIHRGYFGENHDYSEAYPDRLFSRWVGEQDNYIIFDIGASGNPEITVKCLSGEEIYDEAVLISFTGADIKTVKRCDNAIGISTSGTLSTVSFGVFSLFTDLIPLWAEVSTIVGLASVAVQQRVRCLIEFKSEEDKAECAEAEDAEVVSAEAGDDEVEDAEVVSAEADEFEDGEFEDVEVVSAEVDEFEDDEFEDDEVVGAEAEDAEVECDETEVKKQPFIIADLPEIAFIMLDACLHEPLWRPIPVVPVHEQGTAHDSVPDEA